MYEYLAIDYDGNVDHIEQPKEVNSSYIRNIIEIEVTVCGSIIISVVDQNGAEITVLKNANNN